MYDSCFSMPAGSFNGSLSSLAAHELGAVVVREALARAKVPPAEVSEVLLGQVRCERPGECHLLTWE